jgi:hypothetical protein
LEKIAPECEDETLDEIIQRMTGMVDGSGVVVMQGLPEICRSWDVPYGKVLLWLMGDEKRYGMYQRALEMQAHAYAAETIGIADELPGTTEKGGTDTGDIAWKKLRIETRLKLAEKHAPRMYGKADGGAGGITVVVNRAVGNPSVVTVAPDAAADPADESTESADSVTIEYAGQVLTVQ